MEEEPSQPTEIASLLEDLSSEDSSTRREAVLKLAAVGEAAVPPLIQALRDQNFHSRRLAAESLGKIGRSAKAAVFPLSELLLDENPQIRESAAGALGRIDRDVGLCVPALTRALNDGVVNVRRSVVSALAKIGNPSIEILTEALKDSDVDVRHLSAEGLGRLGNAAKISSESLAMLLADTHEDVRRAAAEALERIGPNSLPALEKLAKNPAGTDPELLNSTIERIKHTAPRQVVQGEYPSKDDVFEGTYKILKEIGRGAEAAVYKASVLKPMPVLGLDEGELVIVKYYHFRKPGTVDAETELARWFRGYDLTRNKPIDGLRRVFDFRPKWIAILQWIPGETLAEAIQARTGSVPDKAGLVQLIASFLRIVDALIQLNRRGLVFRDLKPENIIVTTAPDGHQTWTLIDTGLLTEVGFDGSTSLSGSATALGTPLYGAPELLDAETRYPRGSEAVDIYTVGSTLYKIVTGEDMFSGSYNRVIRTKALPDAHDNYMSPDRINPNLDNRLTGLIRKCLRFRPEDRHSKLQLVYNELKQWLSAQQAGHTAKIEPAYDVFIAHATPDSQIADELQKQLSPPYSVFLAHRQLEPGGQWPDEIREAQERSRMTVALLSSSTSAAHYEVEEIHRAIELVRKNPSGHKLVPVYLESMPAPYGLALFQNLTVEESGGVAAVAARLRDMIAKV